MPDTPSEPISSLSASMHTAVRSGRAQLEQGGQGGIGAHPVVVAVGADQGAVEADVHRPEGGDGAQLGGEEVLLHDAVLPVEQLQHRQLHPVAALVVPQGAAAHQDVQALRGDGLPQGLLAPGRWPGGAAGRRW